MMKYLLTAKDRDGKVYTVTLNLDELAGHVSAKLKFTDHIIVSIVLLP